MLQELYNYLNYTDFKEFLNNNAIISTATGVIIAYAAWDLIKSLVGDIVLPSIYFIFIHPFIEKEIVSIFFEPIEKINIPNFTKNIASFIIMVIITFVTIQYITNNWIKVNYSGQSRQQNQQTQIKEYQEQKQPAPQNKMPISMTPVTNNTYDLPYQFIGLSQ
jgi:large-conductance mechanosensitive channel